MSEPTEALSEDTATAERRLHPWSWLFVLLQQLRQFIFPLVALLVFGSRGNDDGPWWVGLTPLIAVVVLVVVSVMQYLTYRYRIGNDRLTIRSGWLQRSVREIPFARIHNVGLHQSLLHRIFGVAEVRLESAGGQKPEAEMRVLRWDQALALEQQIRHGHTTPTSATETTTVNATDGTLLALPLPEVIRLGLVSNRGMIVAAAAVGGASQVMPRNLLGNYIETIAEQSTGYLGALHLGWIASFALAIALLLTAAVFLRVLSVVLALLQYTGFRLSEADRRLTVERGLLTRMRTSVARRRIQSWTLQEGFLHRLLKRRSLGIDTAAAQQQGTQQHDQRALKELAPIATPEVCDALVQHVLPKAQWPREDWQPVAAGQWWRLCLFTALWVPALTTVLCLRFGTGGALLLLWLPWAAYKARKRVQRMGWSADADLVTVRGGWWSRWWRFAEVDKLQALRLERGPLDRACGTASLILDTAGARATIPLRLALMPVAQAEALYAELSRTLARRRLQW